MFRPKPIFEFSLEVPHVPTYPLRGEVKSSRAITRGVNATYKETRYKPERSTRIQPAHRLARHSTSANLRLRAALYFALEAGLLAELKGSLSDIGLVAIVQLIGEVHHSGRLELRKGATQGT